MTNRKAYPTDLTNKQWKLLRQMLPQDRKVGRKRKVDLREVINAIAYLIRAGCAWRMLPHEFPPWQTVYRYFRRWRELRLFKEINEKLREKVRKMEKRKKSPSAAIIDSQSVKTTEQGGERGYDAGKKIAGRKRHIIVDTIGLLLFVVVHTADIQDRDGAKLVFNQIEGCFPRLKLIWADGGYAGKLVDWVKEQCKFILEIVKRSDDAQGFELLPRRWVVERTFAWLNKNRRLSKDYETLTLSSETFVYASMVFLMLRRLKPTSF